jgi:hypothetical protein
MLVALCCVVHVSSDGLICFPSVGGVKSTIVLSQHKYGQPVAMVSGLPPKSSTLDSESVDALSAATQALNDSSSAPGSGAAMIHWNAEIVTNRACSEKLVASVSAKANFMLITQSNWVEAMGPIFGQRALTMDEDLKAAARKAAEASASKAGGAGTRGRGKASTTTASSKRHHAALTAGTDEEELPISASAKRARTFQPPSQDLELLCQGICHKKFINAKMYECSYCTGNKGIFAVCCDCYQKKVESKSEEVPLKTWFHPSGHHSFWGEMK